MSGAGIAEISQSGFFNALGTGDGDVVIRDSSTDGSGVYSEVSISVSNQVFVESVAISSSSLLIDVLQGSLQLNATILPENASRKEIAWNVSEGDSKASIDQEGLLTASGIGNGLVRVKASANDGSGISEEVDITLSNQAVGVKTGIIDEIKVRSLTNSLLLTFTPTASQRRVQLYSLDGKLLEITKIQSYTESVTIPMKNYNSGNYLLKFGFDGKVEAIVVYFSNRLP